MNLVRIASALLLVLTMPTLAAASGAAASDIAPAINFDLLPNSSPVIADCSSDALTTIELASYNFTPSQAAEAPCDDLCACCRRFGHAHCCEPCAGCIEPEVE